MQSSGVPQATRESKRLLVWGVAMLAASVALDARSEHGEAGSTTLEGLVVGITDGDTLTLLVERVEVRIRLAQIDAPESGQAYGRAAREALSELAFGQQVRVEVVDRDRYGRSVGELFVDDIHVNQEMVRRGYAWAYTKYSRSLEIIELEDEARSAKRGLWALPVEQRDAPWTWRRGKKAPRASKADPAPLACGNRHTCKEMATCEEARFYFTECELTRLDGDRDGVPCEQLCAARR